MLAPDLINLMIEIFLEIPWPRFGNISGHYGSGLTIFR
jgi:hypothetical protein